MNHPAKRKSAWKWKHRIYIKEMVFLLGILKYWSIISIHGGLYLQLGVPALPCPGGKLPGCCPEPTLLREPVWATAVNTWITLSKQHGHIANSSSSCKRQLRAMISVQHWSKRQQIIFCHLDSLLLPLLFFQVCGFPFRSMLNWGGCFI